MDERTKPKPRGVDHTTNPAFLAAGRYGTADMIKVWGAEQTFEYHLRSQAAAIATISELYPEIIPPKYAAEIEEKANLDHIDPARIRELEDKTHHDIIAVNTALEEQVSREAGSYINLARTSADTTETTKALQLKKSIEIIVDSLENLRDITIEKAMELKSPFMDTTHLYDAVPTIAGRPFMFYVEALQSDLETLKWVYDNSIRGKWADATGNHHSAKTLGIDGMKLQEKYCEKLGIGHMDAPAQIPAREYVADVVYAVARTAETLANLAQYIAIGKGDDFGVFIDENPRKRKGSSAMPHKDAKGGNPTVEEQIESLSNYCRGALATAMSSCRFRYGRDLSASSSDRIVLEDLFKFSDHGIRRLAGAVYHLGLNKGRSLERINRTYGIVTSPQIMTYLTDSRHVSNPMTRSEAHDLVGQLATDAYKTQTPFKDVLSKNEEISSRLSEEKLEELTSPWEYTGQSSEIMYKIKEKCYKKKTLSGQERII